MKLRRSARANREFAQAADYLIEQNPAAARRFAAAIELALRNIQEHPKIGTVTNAGSGQYRQYTLSNYPYKIFYRLESDTIFIISIFHTAQDPGKI